jgi:hypothetical protein
VEFDCGADKYILAFRIDDGVGGDERVLVWFENSIQARKLSNYFSGLEARIKELEAELAKRDEPSEHALEDTTIEITVAEALRKANVDVVELILRDSKNVRHRLTVAFDGTHYLSEAATEYIDVVEYEIRNLSGQLLINGYLHQTVKPGDRLGLQ